MFCHNCCSVALRKESVDRNAGYRNHPDRFYVALRKESVDRNCGFADAFCAVSVALRKESVDRNVSLIASSRLAYRSLSARRAWIEMTTLCCCGTLQIVALRKESVDRNCTICPSPWRSCLVALRKESVDRNTQSVPALGDRVCRSPQGERG